MGIRVSNADLASLLKISRQTVWDWTKRGFLPEPTKGVGCKLYDLAEVLKAIEANGLRVDPETLVILRVGKHPLEARFEQGFVDRMKVSLNGGAS